MQCSSNSSYPEGTARNPGARRDNSAANFQHGRRPGRPSRRRGRRGQQHRRLFREGNEELLDPRFRQPGVEVVGPQKGATPRSPGQPHYPPPASRASTVRADLTGGGLLAERLAAPAPGQVVPVRARKRVAPPLLQGQPAVRMRQRRSSTESPPGRVLDADLCIVAAGSPRELLELVLERPVAPPLRCGRTADPATQSSSVQASSSPRALAFCPCRARRRSALRSRRARHSAPDRRPRPASHRARAGRETAGEPQGSLSSSRCSGARKTAGARAENSRKIAASLPAKNSRPVSLDHSTESSSRPAARSTVAQMEKRSPSRAMAAEAAPRNERWPHTRATASRRFVLPCAFSPVMSVTPAPNETESEERLRKPWFESCESCKWSCPTSIESEAHRHDDVHVSGRPFDSPLRLAEALGVFVLQVQPNALATPPPPENPRGTAH